MKRDGMPKRDSPPWPRRAVGPPSRAHRLKFGAVAVVAAFWSTVCSGAAPPSRVVIDAGGWSVTPLELREAELETTERVGRGPASARSTVGPRIDVRAPKQPARFVVEGSRFPTFPVRVEISSGEGEAVDGRTLKVVAHKGILFKNITSDVEDHLTAADCDPEGLCRSMGPRSVGFVVGQRWVGRHQRAP